MRDDLTFKRTQEPGVYRVADRFSVFLDQSSFPERSYGRHGAQTTHVRKRNVWVVIDEHERRAARDNSKDEHERGLALLASWHRFESRALAREFIRNRLEREAAHSGMTHGDR